jgi:hypothetical protein
MTNRNGNLPVLQVPDANKNGKNLQVFGAFATLDSSSD